MLSFLTNLFERRRQRKASTIVINSLLDSEVSTWLSYTTFSTGTRKVPLTIKNIRFDENTLLYEAILQAPFNNEILSFVFKIQIDHYYSTSFTVIDLTDKSNYLAWVNQSSGRLKGAFLYYGVKEELVKSLRLHSAKTKEQSKTQQNSISVSSLNRSESISNNPMYQSEQSLLNDYVSFQLLTDSPEHSYSKHTHQEPHHHSLSNTHSFHSHDSSSSDSSSSSSD